MKAYNIKDGVQFSCDLQGECWSQGGILEGIFDVNNSQIPGKVILAQGSKKKIKNRESGAYVILDECTFTAPVTTDKFEFKLPLNFPLDDIYLLFGSGEDLFTYGVLALSVQPTSTILHFLETFNLFFKFKCKKLKSTKKGEVEAKLEVPTSKQHSKIDSLKLLFTQSDDGLLVVFHFAVNKVSFIDSQTAVSKEKIKVEKFYTPKDLLVYGDAFNQELVRSTLEDILMPFSTNIFKPS